VVMKPLVDGQPALAEDRADTTSGRCETSRHPTPTLSPARPAA
jgi:hypothetical protein